MKKIESQNNYIYVVLVKSLTVLGKLSRLTSNYEYTHIAVCLDEKLEKFYSFSRRKHYVPFDCGFMVETLDCYAFGKNNKVKLKVYKVPILKQNRRNIEDYINNIANDSNYIFNFYSMITMPIFHGFKIYKAHNCMSFVSEILKLTNNFKMEKKFYKYNIKDMDELLSSCEYEEKDFYKKEIINKDYMKYASIIKNFYFFIKLNLQLIYRMLRKENKENEE